MTFTTLHHTEFQPKFWCNQQPTEPQMHSDKNVGPTCIKSVFSCWRRRISSSWWCILSCISSCCRRIRSSSANRCSSAWRSFISHSRFWRSRSSSRWRSSTIRQHFKGKTRQKITSCCSLWHSKSGKLRLNQPQNSNQHYHTVIPTLDHHGCHYRNKPPQSSSLWQWRWRHIFQNYTGTPHNRCCTNSSTPRCHDARSKHRAEVQVFSDEQPHVTTNISKQQFWFIV